jgi:hypothetical protein
MPDGWREAVTAAYERKLTGADLVPAGAPAVDRVVVDTLAPAVVRATGEPLEPLRSFVPRVVAAGARRPHVLRYLPPIGPSATYEGLVLVARAWRAGHPVTSRMLTGALAGRPLSLALQASALPLYLGIVRADPALVRAAADGLAWAGVPAREVRAADGAAQLAELLRRRWAVAT